MTIADINALLYLAGRHDVEELRRAAAHPGVEPGLAELLKRSSPRRSPVRAGGGNAGLDGPGTAAGWPGFRTLRVAAKHPESTDVVSLELESEDGRARSPTPGPGSSSP